MKPAFTSLVLLSLWVSFPLFSQTSQDRVVPMTASVQTNPPSVTLNWGSTTPTADFTLFRREKDAAVWYVLLDVSASGQLSFTDMDVEIGKTYEYGMERFTNNIYAYGYVTVPIEAPAVEERGKVLVFVEEALQQPLAVELERFDWDLRGDGWQTVWHPVAIGATIDSVKSDIIADYNTDPENVKAVFLLGEIPVPYSGNTNWDGHGDHTGAWPADTWYGDIDFTWTDNVVNNTTPARPENDNIPGDGKFDYSFAPSETELAVGRVDFSNLSEATFGTTRTELYRRYLNKNHNWRNKLYTVQNKALIDDNFGYFNGEAFGANGYRNGYPLVGMGNVEEGDFFNDTDGEGYLMAYGCGGGTYTSAGGVGNSDNFAIDSVNAVFSMLFGSYHGDWDYSPNPFMPSALASKGGILSCAWAGRPHWFFHHLGAGETLGYCAVVTQNACDVPGYTLPNFPDVGILCGAHVALLGDPTLRAQIVAPATDLTAVNKCHTVDLSWTASADGDILGYNVYRSANENGPFTRLNNDPLEATAFTDASPVEDMLYYQVRAIKLEETPSGRFYNMSTGVFASTLFSIGAPPVVSATDDSLTCVVHEVTISATADVPSSYEWTLLDGTVVPGQTITVDEPGQYMVEVTDLALGCVTTAFATVKLNDMHPMAAPAPSGAINCADISVTVYANPGWNGYALTWTGPGGFYSEEKDIEVSEPGEYQLFIIDTTNGCTITFPVEVELDTVAPQLELSPVELTCADSLLILDCPPGLSVNCSWEDASGNDIPIGSVVYSAGLYTLTVTSLDNGCTARDVLEISENYQEPDLAITGNFEINCNGPATLNANSNTSPVSFQWSGPNGFSSTQQNLTVNTAGTYFLEAENLSNGCVAIESVQITQTGNFPVANPVANGVLTCANTTVNLLANPEMAGYTFLWSGPGILDPDVQNPFANEPGSYSVLVTNPSTGCTASYSTVVTENIQAPVFTLPPVEINCIVTSFPLICPPLPYDCVWADENGNPIPAGTVVSGPGPYILTLTDLANGCSASDTLQIIDNTAVPDLTITGDETVPCFGETTTLTATSGTPGVIFNWSGGIFTNPLLPTQTVSAGTYIVTATAPNGCSDSYSVNVTEPEELELTVISTVDCQGFVTPVVSVTGGTTPFSYIWTPQPPIPPNTEFSVTIVDANGCIESAFIGIAEPFVPLSVSVSHTNETIAGANDGSASAQVSSGTPPYTYAWSNGQTNATITNLPPGDYTVTITDADGCSATASAAILEGASAAGEMEGLKRLSISPNPTSGLLDVSLEIDYPSEIWLEITDVNGKSQVRMAKETATEKTWLLDLTGYPAGIYFCRVWVDGKAVSRRVAKVE